MDSHEKYGRDWSTSKREKRLTQNHKTCDKREKHMMEHIMKFSVVELQYVRKEAKCEYFPQELIITEMCRLCNL